MQVEGGHSLLLKNKPQKETIYVFKRSSCALEATRPSPPDLVLSPPVQAAEVPESRPNLPIARNQIKCTASAFNGIVRVQVRGFLEAAVVGFPAASARKLLLAAELSLRRRKRCWTPDICGDGSHTPPFDVANKGS